MSAQNRQVVSLTHAKEPRRTKREATGTGQKYFITMKASLQPSQVSSSHPFISPPPSRCLCIPVSPCLYTPRLPTRRIHHLVLFVDFLSTSPLPPFLPLSSFRRRARAGFSVCVCVCVHASSRSLFCIVRVRGVTRAFLPGNNAPGYFRRRWARKRGIGRTPAREGELRRSMLGTRLDRRFASGCPRDEFRVIESGQRNNVAGIVSGGSRGAPTLSSRTDAFHISISCSVRKMRHDTAQSLSSENGSPRSVQFTSLFASVYICRRTSPIVPVASPHGSAAARHAGFPLAGGKLN